MKAKVMIEGDMALKNFERTMKAMFKVSKTQRQRPSGKPARKKAKA
jgi:hypothetical protein